MASPERRLRSMSVQLAAAPAAREQQAPEVDEAIPRLHASWRRSIGELASIPYLRRSHGEHYSAAAVARLRLPDFGAWDAYHSPVPSCRCGSAGLDVLDFRRGVDASGHVDGEAAVGKWDETRRGMYGSESQATQTRDLHIGVDLCAPAGATSHRWYSVI
jgi:hypothetical protein